MTPGALLWLLLAVIVLGGAIWEGILIYRHQLTMSAVMRRWAEPRRWLKVGGSILLIFLGVFLAYHFYWTH